MKKQTTTPAAPVQRPRALSKAQIDAVIDRLREQLQPRFDALETAKRKANNDERRKQLEVMFSEFPHRTRMSIIKALGNSDVIGVKDHDYGYGYRHTQLEKMLKDLRYTLIMADNTSCDAIIAKFEADAKKLLAKAS